jgi:hypothetical protein
MTVEMVTGCVALWVFHKKKMWRQGWTEYMYSVGRNENLKKRKGSEWYWATTAATRVSERQIGPMIVQCSRS